MSEKEENKIGVAWYTKEQWKKLKKIADDFKGNETYKKWKKDMEKLMKELKKSGETPEKIYVDIEKLKKWCLKNNKPITSESRSTYVAHLLRKKYQNQQDGKKPF